MYQELPSVAAIIVTRIHSSSMVIPFPITPSGLTSVKKDPQVSGRFSTIFLITTERMSVLKSALQVG